VTCAILLAAPYSLLMGRWYQAGSSIAGYRWEDVAWVTDMAAAFLSTESGHAGDASLLSALLLYSHCAAGAAGGRSS